MGWEFGAGMVQPIIRLLQNSIIQKQNVGNCKWVKWKLGKSGPYSFKDFVSRINEVI